MEGDQKARPGMKNIKTTGMKNERRDGVKETDMGTGWVSEVGVCVCIVCTCVCMEL